jgi:uncharacterized protein
VGIVVIAVGVVVLAVIGVAVYKIQNASRPQLTNSSAPLGTNGLTSKPSFDCAKARSPVELLICRDNHLAETESAMASSYHHALNRLPRAWQLALRKEQIAWLKNYSGTCDESPSDAERTTCIANFLLARTTTLNNWR